jgi:hypothetical protein
MFSHRQTFVGVRRALRILVALGVAVLCAEALYLGAVNVLLSTSLFDRVVNATPDAVDIHYARGWSLFPTRVHARGLSIRGTDSHVEWILRFDEVEFDCSLLELARKRFHVNWARGSGITFRARLKVASPAATLEHVRFLPPIDSLGPLAFIPDQAPDGARWNDKDWHLWTVRIDDAIAEHVREVWIEQGRFQGDARVAGGFYLKPIRAAEVGPAHVDVRGGRVTAADRVVAEPLVASIDFELERFDPRVTTGAELIHHISLSADAKIEVPDLDSLPLRLPDAVRLSGALEIPRLAVRVRKGVVGDGAHVDARATRVLVAIGTHVVTGALDLTADVRHDRLVARASVEHFETDVGVSVPRATVTLESTALDLDNPLAEGRVRGDLGVHATDVDLLAGKLRVRGDANVEVSVGSLHASPLRAAEVQVAATVVDGLAAPGASPTEPFVHVTGLHALAEAADVDLQDPLRSLQASVVVPHGELFDREAARAALGLGSDVRLATRRALFAASATVALDGDRATATFEAQSPEVGLEYAGRRLDFALTADARAHASDWHRAVLSLDTARVVGTHVALSDAATAHALSIERLSIAATSPAFSLTHPLARLDVVGTILGGRLNTGSALQDLLPGWSTTLVSTEAARFDGHVAARIDGHVVRGTAALTGHGIGVASDRFRIAGDAAAVVNVSGWDFTRKTVGGDVALALRSVTGSFGPRTTGSDFVADRIDVGVSAAALDLRDVSTRGVEYRLRIAQAELVDARALNAFVVSPQIVSIESGRALVSADIDTSRLAPGPSGRVDVSLIDAGIRLHETHLAGDFVVALRTRGFDPERTMVDVEGSSVAMQNVRVTGASTDTSGWRGDLVVETGTFGLAPAPRFEADLTLRARDASPFLGALFRDTLPKVVAGWTRMPSLTAVAHIVVEPQGVVVSDLMASGGDLTLRGTLVIRDGERRGAFVTHMGPWSVGFNLDKDGAQLRLFGLDRWYADRVRQVLTDPEAGPGVTAAMLPGVQ